MTRAAETEIGMPVMTEDELLTGILDAMGLRRWLAHHDRRSDKALTMGSPGLPDIIAVPPGGHGPVLALECKSDKGHVTPDQAFWLATLRSAGATCAVVRPKDYDRAVRLILADDSTHASWDWGEHL